MRRGKDHGAPPRPTRPTARAAARRKPTRGTAQMRAPCTQEEGRGHDQDASRRREEQGDPAAPDPAMPRGAGGGDGAEEPRPCAAKQRAA